MPLGQPDGALLQCLERYLLPLLPAAALACLSCSCRALHVWLSCDHTTSAWRVAASRELPAPYLPLAPDLGLSEVTAILRREAAIQKQLRLGICATVEQIASKVWSVQAYSEKYFVCSKPFLLQAVELLLCSLDTGLVLAKITHSNRLGMHFRGEHLLILHCNIDIQRWQVSTLAVPSMLEVSCVRLASAAEANSFDFSPDGLRAGMGGGRAGILSFAVYEISSGSLIASRSDCGFISWHPSQSIVALWSREKGNSHLVVWDYMVDQIIYTVQGEFAQLYGKTWSPDGKWFACYHFPNNNPIFTCYVQVLQALNGQSQLRSRQSDERFFQICYSSDSSKAIVNNRDDSLGWEVFDIQSASVLHSVHHVQDVLGFSPRGNVYAAMNNDGILYMYDATSGHHCARWDLPAMAANTIAAKTALQEHSAYNGNSNFWSALGDRIVVWQGITVHRRCERLYLVKLV